jgi:hypothetical protein
MCRGLYIQVKKNEVLAGKRAKLWKWRYGGRM